MYILKDVIIWFMNIYHEMTRRENGIRKMISYVCSDTYVKEYNCIHNNRDISIVCMNGDDLDFENIDHFERKMINHCCIMEGGRYSKDITEDLRKFHRYFKGGHGIKWKVFILYIDLKDNQEIMVYYNDDDFTEYIVKPEDELCCVLDEKIK